MPTNKDRALAAHCHVLGLAASMPDGIDMSAEPVGRWVALALLARLLHLGEAIHRLVDERFGDAVEPLARAMTSASISIVTIVDGDSDNRALAFPGGDDPGSTEAPKSNRRTRLDGSASRRRARDCGQCQRSRGSCRSTRPWVSREATPSIRCSQLSRSSSERFVAKTFANVSSACSRPTKVVN